MADELINDMTGENDPVADFLQREQDQLAGLDESFGEGAVSYYVVHIDIFIQIRNFLRNVYLINNITQEVNKQSYL